MACNKRAFYTHNLLKDFYVLDIVLLGHEKVKDTSLKQLKLVLLIRKENSFYVPLGNVDQVTGENMLFCYIRN